MFDLVVRLIPLVYSTPCVLFRLQNKATRQDDHPNPSRNRQWLRSGFTQVQRSEDPSPTSRAHTRSPYSGTRHCLHTLPTWIHATLALWLTDTEPLSDKHWSHPKSQRKGSASARSRCLSLSLSHTLARTLRSRSLSLSLSHSLARSRLIHHIPPDGSRGGS